MYNVLGADCEGGRISGISGKREVDHVGMARGAHGSGRWSWIGGWWEEAAWEGETRILVGGLRKEPGCGLGENASPREVMPDKH